VLLTQGGQAWRRLDPNQRVTVLAAVLLTVCAAVALTMWARRPDFVMLYSGLDSAEGAAIVERLEADKVPYRLTRGGTAIEVPHARLYQLRMEMASRGVVKPAHLGFEIFDRHDIGMTDFVQKTNYRRALEGELARTIESLEDVEGARVHIVVPEPSLFADDERRPSASILLTLARGSSIGREEVAGITRLVAGSVEGLKPDDVTVVSSEGTVLSLAGEAEGPMGLTSRQLAARQAVENYLTHKAQ
jgi:flagellar M-ring protein FliF